MDFETEKPTVFHEDTVTRVVFGLLRAGKAAESKTSCEAAFALGLSSPVLVLAYAYAALELEDRATAERALAQIDALAPSLSPPVLAARDEVQARLPRLGLKSQALSFFPKLPAKDRP